MYRYVLCLDNCKRLASALLSFAKKDAKNAGEP